MAVILTEIPAALKFLMSPNSTWEGELWPAIAECVLDIFCDGTGGMFWLKVGIGS